VVPIPAELVAFAEQHRLVVTVEDSGRHGGVGSALSAVFRDAECDVPLRDLAVPQSFHAHGSRAEVLARIGLTAQDVARRVTEWASTTLGDEPEPAAKDS
jgi:1-deoxy-D-xylulose-5-phosphate synthase